MGAFKRQDLMDRHYRQQWEEAERMDAEYFESLYLNSLPVVKTDPGDEQPEEKPAKKGH